MNTETPDTVKHTVLDDVQGLGFGVFMCAIGLQILTSAGLITGQTAGIAVILSYVTGWGFGPVFFVINIPFYIIAYLRLGLAFTIKSLISVTALSLVSELLPLGWTVGEIHIGLAALMFGAIVGCGLLAMFRHNGSLGGLGVVALLIQDTTGFRAGYVQLIADAVIFAVGFLLFPLGVVLWSLAGAVVLNMVIALNHRRDRYIAT
ncbi:YitT family protein [Pseudoruegeria sp. HB172150]|uniref:YitT family protein n=1 Tax=Pseudoruegeria sp. HB172150 TaxID=2721164 RepID=UPI0015536921|nr:YitT family protein [Pseudoruegeria sp. HB172150]